MFFSRLYFKFASNYCIAITNVGRIQAIHLDRLANTFPSKLMFCVQYILFRSRITFQPDFVHVSLASTVYNHASLIPLKTNRSHILVNIYIKNDCL